MKLLVGVRDSIMLANLASAVPKVSIRIFAGPGATCGVHEKTGESTVYK